MCYVAAKAAYLHDTVHRVDYYKDAPSSPSVFVQENLYEDDVKDKAKAASCIATLFKQAQHLEPLLSHATLLPTLARVLRDDGKRSVELCIAIQSVWLVLSNFSQFHQLLVDNQVGVSTLEVLDLEIKRTEHRIKVSGTACSTGVVGICSRSHSALFGLALAFEQYGMTAGLNVYTSHTQD